jgi:hypothetical protein
MRDNRDDLLVEYYVSHRASAIINYNELTKISSKVEKLEECLRNTKISFVIIDGENKKEHGIFDSKN